MTYTTPWLFIIPFTTELSGYYRRHDSLLFSPPMGFSGEFAGGELTFSRSTEYGLGYEAGLRYESILRLDAASIDTLPASVPKRDTRSLKATVSFDRRNDVFTPTNGFFARLASEIAGLFGGETNRYVKTEMDVRWYQPIGKVHLRSGMRLGWVRSFGGAGSAVPPQEQFFAGGSRSVRGYKYEHLLIDEEDRPLGGNVLAELHPLDVSFPLFWRFRGGAFIDAGYLWRDISSIAPRNIKFGAGPGIRVTTPVGLIRFDVGFKLNPDSNRERVAFYLDVGQPF